MAEQKAEKVKTKKSLIEILKEKEETGMARTNSWVSLWQDSLRYFLSDQLHGRKEHRDWDWVILNYIWPAIMQEMAKLSRDFKIIASPIEPEDEEFAEAFGGFLNFQWSKTGKPALHQNGMRIEQLNAILCGKLYGYRVSKIFWDGKVTWNDKVFPPKWDGEVKHRLWRPSQFWASDNEYINDGDCGTVRWVDLEYAKDRWPDYVKALESAALTYTEMKVTQSDHIRGQSGTSANYPNKDKGDQDRGLKNSPGTELLDLVLASDRQEGLYENKEDRLYCKISETYLKDFSSTKEKKDVPYEPEELVGLGMANVLPQGGYVDQEGNSLTAENWPIKQHHEWDLPKYPNGRFVIRNEDTILNPKEEDQVYPHSVWPFVVTPHYLLPFMWQGTDAVTLYKTTQDHVNVTVSHLVNNMKMFGNPRIAVEDDALSSQNLHSRTRKKYTIFSGAGSIIRLARGGLKKYKVEPPAAPSPTVGMLYQLFAQEFKNLTGLHDIAQGKKTSGSTTATEAQFLAISSNDRIKLQNVFEESWVLRCVTLVAEMDQYYYEVGRIVRVIGSDKVMGAQQVSEGAKTFGYDLGIEAVEGLPYDEEKKIEKYTMAYKMLSDPNPNPMLPEMLMALDIPSWQKIVQKHQGWVLYMGFVQLIEAVNTGQMDPQEAVQIIVQKTAQFFQEQENGNSNSRKPQENKRD